MRRTSGFALINALDIAVNADTQATLTAATKVLDPATTGLRELAAGTRVNVPAQSVVQFPAAAVVPIAARAVVTSLFNLPAVFIVLAVTVLLVIGVSESATVNNIIVAIKVTVIIAVHRASARSSSTPTTGIRSFPSPPASRTSSASTASSAPPPSCSSPTSASRRSRPPARKRRNPRKDMPIGILGSLIICTVLYMLTAAVLTGVVSFTKLNVAAPVATAVDTFGPQWGWLAKLIKIGAIAGLSSVVLVLMFGQTRVFYSMSRDGLLPKVLGKVHPKFKTPWINTIIVGVVVSLAAAVFDINYLGDMTSVGTLVAFGLVCFSVIWLRVSGRTCRVTSRCRCIRCCRRSACLACFVLAYIGVEAHIRWFFFWFIAGSIALYFMYGFWVSPLRNKPAEAEKAVVRQEPGASDGGCGS